MKKSLKRQLEKPQHCRSHSQSNSINSFQRKRFSSITQVKSKNCVFCQKLQNIQRFSFAPLLSKALYTKYSSSQNYYYARDINDILENESTVAVIQFRDLETQIEDEEFLKRFYYPSELKLKLNSLLEYYKYHKDIPRMFMKHISKTIFRFHDKKRRLLYTDIKRQLGIQDQQSQERTSRLFQDKSIKKTSQDCSINQLKNILQGYNFDEQNIDDTLYFKEMLEEFKEDFQYSFIDQENTQQKMTIQDLSDIGNSNKKQNKVISSQKLIQKLILQQKSQLKLLSQQAAQKKVQKSPQVAKNPKGQQLVLAITEKLKNRPIPSGIQTDRTVRKSPEIKKSCKLSLKKQESAPRIRQPLNIFMNSLEHLSQLSQYNSRGNSNHEKKQKSNIGSPQPFKKKLSKQFLIQQQSKQEHY